MNAKLCISIIGGAIGAAITSDWGFFTLAVIVAVVADVITGLIKAKVTNEGFSSEIGTVGFFKKMGFFIALGLGAYLDILMPKMLGAGLGITMTTKIPFFLVIACYIIITELMSIAENLYKINPQALPGFVITALKTFKDDLENKK